MDQAGFTFDGPASCNAVSAAYEIAYTAAAQTPLHHRGGLSRRSLERALIFMETHLGDSIGLPDIASAACLSRAHFARMFRVSTGVSVMSYLTSLRIESAKSRLLDGEQNLAELACALGFCDQSHFCRVFRRSVGVPPGRFARNAVETQHLRSSTSPFSTLRSTTGHACL